MGGESNHSREVRFLLSGPRVDGLVAWIHGHSFDGAPEVEVLNGLLGTGGELSYSMSVLPHFFYTEEGRQSYGVNENANSKAVPETTGTTETHVLALACRTRKLSETYADDRFLEEARRGVEDMCLLLSLLAGGTITWHAYYQSAPGYSIRYNRSLADRPKKGHGEEICGGSARASSRWVRTHGIQSP